MKVNNETKIGALAAVSITFLVLGYNYLSGKDSLFSKTLTLHANYQNVSGLGKSNPVLVNGFKVGSVTDIIPNENGSMFTVEFDITSNINIPKNSTARIISADLFGGKAIELVNGSGTPYVQDGDELKADIAAGLTEAINNRLEPIVSKLNNVLAGLDTLLNSGEINGAVAELTASLRSFRQTSDQLNKTLAGAGPQFEQILADVQSITGNLKNNNAKISAILSNMETTSQNLAALKLKETVDAANAAMGNLSQVLDKINKGEGTMGMLVNDKSLYENLNKTAIDLDVILKDLNQFPAKYIPVPGTKRQRKKAMEASKKANGH